MTDNFLAKQKTQVNKVIMTIILYALLDKICVYNKRVKYKRK
jgi:hypothetical protein